MPRTGMMAIRKDALVNATIAEIGRAGHLNVTMGQIAKAAGVSSALAHHYFGSKDDLLLAAMRAILAEFGAEARVRLAGAGSAFGRLKAIAEASFEGRNFRPEVISAWLTFYVMAQRDAEAARVLVLENIPQLSRSNFNEAKRFVTLIDALYEAKVKLICSAAAAPEYLYVEGEGTFEFERTASRLREMQSDDWGRH